MLLLGMLACCLFFEEIFLAGEAYGVWERNDANRNSRNFGKRTRRQPIDGNSINDRQSRFLSLFTVVKFERDACVGLSGDKGTCLPTAVCGQKKGKANGPCAAGFGCCCTFLASCGMTVVENGTIFVQEGYPNTYDDTGSCQVTLMKPKDVCQYRLDFDEFTVTGPETTNNVCNNDQFIVSGGSPTPAICGENAGNHMYVDAGVATSNLVVLSMVTSGPSFARSWRIRITQIACSSALKAEDGCLQYYAGVSGRIKSFNYDPMNGLQLSNQDYSVCVRPERNFCGIQYTQCPDQGVNNRSQSFTLSGNSNNAVQAMVGSTGQANYCQNDYLIVPMATNVGRPATGPVQNVDRLCGGVLSADVTLIPTPVRSLVKPFRLFFHTDGLEAPSDVSNKGFCLDYVQQPCGGNF